VCREAIPQISNENWEDLPADGSEVEGWHNHLARVRCLSLSRDGTSVTRVK